MGQRDGEENGDCGAGPRTQQGDEVAEWHQGLGVLGTAQSHRRHRGLPECWEDSLWQGMCICLYVCLPDPRARPYLPLWDPGVRAQLLWVAPGWSLGLSPGFPVALGDTLDSSLFTHRLGSPPPLTLDSGCHGWGWVLPPGGHPTVSGGILGRNQCGLGELLASNGWWLGVLLSTLQCTGWPTSEESSGFECRRRGSPGPACVWPGVQQILCGGGSEQGWPCVI